MFSGLTFKSGSKKLKPGFKWSTYALGFLCFWPNTNLKTCSKKIKVCTSRSSGNFLLFDAIHVDKLWKKFQSYPVFESGLNNFQVKPGLNI